MFSYLSRTEHHSATLSLNTLGQDGHLNGPTQCLTISLTNKLLSILQRHADVVRI